MRRAAPRTVEMMIGLNRFVLLPFRKKFGSWFLLSKKKLKTFPSDSLIRTGWPIITLILRLLSNRSLGGHQEFDSVIFVHGTSRTKLGPDLDTRLVSWVSEVWPGVNVKYSDLQQLPAELESRSIVLLCYSWFQDLGSLSRFAQLLEVIRLAFLASRQHCVVLVPLPDTFKVRNSFFAAVITGLCGGHVLMHQNSIYVASSFGFPSVLAPMFWLWPNSAMEEWNNPLPLAMREKIAAVANSGDPRRSTLGDTLAPTFMEEGYTIKETGSLGSYEDYRKFAREVPIVVTTCWLQERFIQGPSWYRKRLSAYTITGRVWEAFASKSLLLCNDNPELRAFGFLPGQHFLDLPSEESLAGWELPSESVIQSIATKGHEHFCQLRKESRRAIEQLIQQQ